MPFCGKLSPTRNGKDHCVSEKGRFAMLHAAQNPLPDSSMWPAARGVYPGLAHLQGQGGYPGFAYPGATPTLSILDHSCADFKEQNKRKTDPKVK